MYYGCYVKLLHVTRNEHPGSFYTYRIRILQSFPAVRWDLNSVIHEWNDDEDDEEVVLIALEVV